MFRKIKAMTTVRLLYPYIKVSKDLDLGETVLDYGCGKVYGTRKLTRRGGVVIGYDPDPKAIIPTDNIEWLTEIKKTGFADKVCCFQVIEHISDTKTFLQSIHKTMKSGATLYITTPYKYLRNRNGKIWNPEHVKEYDLAELTSLIETRFVVTNAGYISGSNDVIRLEKRRIKIGFMRRLLPKYIYSAICNRGRAKITKNNNLDYGLLTEFWVSYNNLNAIDLWVVCRKV